MLGLITLAFTGCEHRKTPPPAEARSAALYRDVAQSAGIDFRWGNGGKTPLTNLETFGTGCAFGDLDDDGWIDILFVSEPTCALYRNRGNGTFREVTRGSGLERARGAWKGCALGDYDGDGGLDLVLTGYNCLAVLKNTGGLKWKDVTSTVGVRPQGWSSSAGFMDLDGDGWLDLVVGSYVIFNDTTRKYCEIVPGVLSGCPPQEYAPQFARVYRNQGGKRFVDISARSGMPSTHGKALALSFCDFNDDGRPDFYLANDGTPGDLMQNLGGGAFRNVGSESGTAFGVLGQAQAGMGVDWGDYDRDGGFDLAVTAFSGEPYSLYHHAGPVFEHAAAPMGIADLTFPSLGFGVKFTDANNDGWSDLVFVNGHVYDNVAQVEPGSTYKQPSMLFLNQAGKRFQLAGAEAGEGFSRPILGRGLAAGDIDNDGREDLLIVDYEGRALLLRNENAARHHWITLDLRGRGPNRLAYGARVEIRAGSQRWIAQVSPSSAYLSSSDPRVHIGLGEVSAVDRVVIRWPDGQRQELTGLAVDRIHRIEQAKPSAPGG